MLNGYEADLTGRVCVVTGATSGIGTEIARNLARMGATVVLPARDVSKGEATAKDIAASGAKGPVHVVPLDIARPASVRAFAKAVTEKFPKISVLVNNAGMWTDARKETADGHEVIWATNVLGPYLLTELLTPALAAGAPARVINVSSTAAGKLNLDDVEWRNRKFSGFDAYMASKQALRMLSWSMAEQLAAKNVHVNAVSPGFVKTRLNDGVGGFAAALVRFAGRLMAQTPAQGADTPTWLAASAQAADIDGRFFKEKRKEVTCNFRDPGARKALWDLCDAMTKES